MVRKLILTAWMIAACGAVHADEPAWLRDSGLSSLKVADDAVGDQVRGTLGVRSTSLAQVSGIVYDSRSGSRFNVDSVNYGAALDEVKSMYGFAGAESVVLAGITGFQVTIENGDGTSFSAAINALSYGAGKGTISPTIPTGPYESN